MSAEPLGYDAPPRWGWIASPMWAIEQAYGRARNKDAAVDHARVRIFFVLAVFFAAFAFLAFGATRASLFSDAGERGSYKPLYNTARADLVDRNGRLLAADLLHYGLYVDPREIWNANEIRNALKAELPGIEAHRLEKALAGKKRAYVLGSLTPAVRDRVNALGLPGVTFEPEEHRAYPLGATAAHVIGFADPAGVGLAGAERAFNDEVRAQSASGKPVALSIDLRIQGALEDELERAAVKHQVKGAVGIVTNVQTGEILGMASYPDFDPNDPGASTADAQVNRAGSTVFEMGSTFKAFTVAAGLDAGVATPETRFDATAPFKLGYRTIRDYHAARKVLTLVEVFQHSSNIGTARLGVALGPQRLSHYFETLGLTKPATVELKESARPLTPKVWNEDAVASTSFGHGINVTPLALSRAMGALLNGGKTIPLTLIKRDPNYRPEGVQALRPETSQQMLYMMRANVTGGSGGSANAEGLRVGGKTGTGEKYDPSIRGYSKSKQVSSFAAVFPTSGAPSDTRYFVLILMDEPKPTKDTYGYSTGGWTAAPAAGRTIDRIAPFLGVARDMTPFDPYAAPETAKAEDGH